MTFFYPLCSFIASALKLDHSRVIDTSFIFKYSNGSIYRRPSLSKLCKVCLRYTLAIVHAISLMDRVASSSCEGFYLPNCRAFVL